MEKTLGYLRKLAPLFIIIFGSCYSLSAQDSYREMDEQKIVFITRYLNLTHDQKQFFLESVKRLDQNLAKLKPIQQNDPQLYLIKLKKLNELFEVQVRTILATNQHGRWKCYQNKKVKEVNACKQKAKLSGWSSQERMNQEILIQEKYTKLGL